MNEDRTHFYGDGCCVEPVSLVEQARELVGDLGAGDEEVDSRDDVMALLAGLANEVERQADEHNDECAVLGQTIMDAHAERDAARARVVALEAGIRVHRDGIRARDRNNPPHIHRGTAAQAPNERLWALLDAGQTDHRDDLCKTCGVPNSEHGIPDRGDKT